MNNYQFLNQPLALEQCYASLLAQDIMAGKESIIQTLNSRSRDGPERIDETAIIEIKGVLVPGTVYYPGWICGYDAIRMQLAEAINLDQIKKIILLIDSPGGVAAGCFDLSDIIYEARKIKPIIAICDSSAYSAAYALASAATAICMPRDGGVGSIGIITMHTDITQSLKQEGIKITTITFGTQKGEKAPTTSLTEGAIRRMQAEVDYLGKLFVETVARNRDLTPEQIRSTEAGTFLGPAGVKAGLADFVASIDEAFLLTHQYQGKKK